MLMQTGFQKKGVSQQYDYTSRRAALRNSWFPNSRESLAGLLQEHGLVVRFVIGHTREAQQEDALALEEATFGGFLRLPIQVGAESPHVPAHQALRWAVDNHAALLIGRLRKPDNQDADVPRCGHRAIRC